MKSLKELRGLPSTYLTDCILNLPIGLYTATQAARTYTTNRKVALKLASQFRAFTLRKKDGVPLKLSPTNGLCYYDGVILREDDKGKMIPSLKKGEKYPRYSGEHLQEYLTEDEICKHLEKRKMLGLRLIHVIIKANEKPSHRPSLASPGPFHIPRGYFVNSEITPFIIPENDITPVVAKEIELIPSKSRFLWVAVVFLIVGSIFLSKPALPVIVPYMHSLE